MCVVSRDIALIEIERGSILTSKKKASYTHIADTATNRGKSRAVEGAKHIVPPIPWSHPNGTGLLVEFYLVELVGRDEGPAVNAGEVVVWVVAARLDSKGLAGSL